MTIEIKHATQAAGTNAGNGEIHREEWNEAHPLTGTPGASIQFDSDGDAEEVAHAFAQLSRTSNLVPGDISETLVVFDAPSAGETEGITHSAGTITLPDDGFYQLLFGGQMGRASGASKRRVDMWIKNNDVDIANSGVRQTLRNNDTDVLFLNFTGRFSAGDEVKCYIAVDNTENSPGMYAFTDGVGADIPAIIASIVKIR